MKNLFTVLLLLIALSVQSQVVTKRETITEIKRGSVSLCRISAYRDFHADTLIDISIHLMGYDDAYPAAREYVTLFSGSPESLSAMLDDVIVFFQQDIGSSTRINQGYTFISIDKAFGSGKKVVRIHDDKVSYTTFTLANITRLRDAFTQWSGKNNVIL